jgi:hypothetical protein
LHLDGLCVASEQLCQRLLADVRVRECTVDVIEGELACGRHCKQLIRLDSLGDLCVAGLIEQH